MITKNDSHPRNPKDLKDKIDQYIEAMVCETEMYLLVVIACVASVSVRFRSKERGTIAKDRAKMA